jgi:ethanolamine permease
VVTILYIAFVLGYAELACALPKAGGVFVYTTRAFGRHVGFLGGVTQVVEYALAPPAVAFAIGSYINQVSGAPVLAVAIAAYVIFTAVNIVGVRLSASFELVLTVVAVIELCVFGAVALPHFSWARFSTDALPHGWGGVFAALPFAIWFYLAIEGIANVAEEAHDPQRDLPRGFFGSMATLVVLTCITLFGAVGAAGWRAVVYVGNQTSDSPLPLAIAHVVSRDSPLFVVLTGIGLVGLVASFHGILIAASRALLEMGRARMAPAALGEIHSRTRTPIVALLVNMGIGIIALLTGRTGDIILIAVFGALALYILSSAAVIRLRMIEPALDRPYRAPLYPVTPIVAFVLAAICLVSMVWSHPWHAALFAGIIAGCWLGYVLLQD